MYGDFIELFDGMVIKKLSDVSLLNNITIRTLTLLDPLSIRGKGRFNFTKETNEFIAVSTLFCIDGNLLANHAR